MPTVTLPHSGLAAPTPHPLVTDLEILQLSCGQAFIAAVSLDGREIGRLENTGSGQATTFQPVERDAASHLARMEEFAAGCSHPVLPLTPPVVYDLLVQEHDTAEIVHTIVAGGCTVARFLVDGAPIGLFAEVAVAPARWLELAGELDQLRDLEAGEGIGGRWQVWDGTAWRDAFPASHTAEPCVSGLTPASAGGGVQQTESPVTGPFLTSSASHLLSTR